MSAVPIVELDTVRTALRFVLQRARPRVVVNAATPEGCAFLTTAAGGSTVIVSSPEVAARLEEILDGLYPETLRTGDLTGVPPIGDSRRSP
ncbi:hypothetical protein ACFVWN_01140 [Nocardiopsis flavescens]|uniref:hypothetical protein n=1 Tax=Nocardiopsis flavescens TaxID=758803 RepID=UPI00365B4CFC